ncbi:FtsX-like permease family protein [Bacillus sp. 1P06AnD]|uniref:FtsX-like permease family protein n=1 Tax=Bacillus sp. 1P06AnD TaxID=3132208 RepID=UPI0039A27F8C
MNVMNKVTIRHLLQNRKRTSVTIIGAIISVAMLAAVATLGYSFFDVMKRQTIAMEGEWHVQYKNVDKGQVAAIKDDQGTQATVISKDIGYAPLKGGHNKNKPYLFIKAYNLQGFKHFPIELRSGRLPKSADEVAISDSIASDGKVHYRIGEELTVFIGNRYMNGNKQPLEQEEPLKKLHGKVEETFINKEKKSYRVVGIIKRPSWEPGWAPGYTVLGYVDESMLQGNEHVNASVLWNNVNEAQVAHAEDLARKNNIDSLQYNSPLLQYEGSLMEGGLQKTIVSLAAILITVIMVGSVSLIYNAFAISVSERFRHLGMLASVGATKRQKRNSVFFEGFIISVISIPIGIVCGVLGIAVTFHYLNAMRGDVFGVEEKLEVIVTPLSLFIACAVSVVTIFVSTYLPAIKASKVTAIEAIRQNTDIKLTGKTVKTPKWISRLFGLEADIALKNMKRNKKRYHITVFSITLSVFLFMTVSFFSTNVRNSFGLSQEELNYDIQVAAEEGTELNGKAAKSIAALDGVTSESLIHVAGAEAWIGTEDVAEELVRSAKLGSGSLQEGKYRFDISIHSMNASNLCKFAKKAGVHYKQLADRGHPSAIVIDTTRYRDDRTGKYTKIKSIRKQAGQQIGLRFTNGNQDREEKVKIAALTDQHPMGINPAGRGMLNIIVSEQVFDSLAGNNREAFLYINSKDPMKTQQQIEQMNVTNLHVYNMYQNRKGKEQKMILVSIFTYGFIVLMSLISIANILNSITTSISLRKREFAMLKSIGMTPKSFNKMIHFESLFYGMKSLIYGLPISFAAMYMIHKALLNKFSYGFHFPWMSLLVAIVAVFAIVGSTMLYASAKVKKENMIDALKQENV